MKNRLPLVVVSVCFLGLFVFVAAIADEYYERTHLAGLKEQNRLLSEQVYQLQRIADSLEKIVRKP